MTHRLMGMANEQMEHRIAVRQIRKENFMIRDFTLAEVIVEKLS
jgi:hypothetical protein